MRKLSIFFFASIMTFFLACDSDELNYKIERVRINHYQYPFDYFESFVGMAYIVQFEDNFGTDSWEYLLNYIEDFEYELGYVYDIEVKKEYIEHPAWDIGKVPHYTLHKIISKTKASDETLFEIVLTLSPTPDYFESYLTQDADLNYFLMRTTEIKCENFYDSLSKNIENKLGMSGIFKHMDSDKIELIEIIVEEE
ncbi:MAG: DUF4377 domain-containing protein [Bacteroidetes bacterium]|nr:DUF4377 domain-containing protein [Bacteroidota bacterium]